MCRKFLSVFVPGFLEAVIIWGSFVLCFVHFSNHMYKCSKAMHRYCNHGSAHSSLHQTLDELSFERGIWQAALDGDDGKLRHIINRRQQSVNEPDSSGYCALVSLY